MCIQAFFVFVLELGIIIGLFYLSSSLASSLPARATSFALDSVNLKGKENELTLPIFRAGRINGDSTRSCDKVCV